MVLAILVIASQLAAQVDPDESRLQAARLVAQGKYTEAEPVLSHLLEQQEKSLGADAPFLAGTIEALAAVYRSEGRNPEAEKLYLRSIAIKEKSAGAQDYGLIPPLKALAGMYTGMGPSRNTSAEQAWLRIISVREK